MTTAGALETMAAGIMGRKKTATARLTPVGNERVNDTEAQKPDGRGPQAPLPFPDDFPVESLRQSILAVRKALEDQHRTAMQAIETALQTINRVAGLEGDESSREEQVRHEAEMAVEEVPAVIRSPKAQAQHDTPADDFAAMFARKQAAAQAQVFKAAQEAEEAPERVAQEAAHAAMLSLTGWTCPVHHHAQERTTQRGRKFRVCPDEGCGQFEKLS